MRVLRDGVRRDQFIEEARLEYLEGCMSVAPDSVIRGDPPRAPR